MRTDSRPKFYSASDSLKLLCPHCGDGRLHQNLIEVFERQCEDAHGAVTQIQGLSICSKPIRAAYIPGRRNSLTIYFWCEECYRHGRTNLRFPLQIKQHKGYTHFSWLQELNVNPAPPINSTS
jgi:hypothetical protein